MPECAGVEQAHYFRINNTRRETKIEPERGEWRQKGVMPLQAEECHRLPAAFQGWGQTEMDVAVLEEGTLTPGIWPSILQNCEADSSATEATHPMTACYTISTH